MSSVKEENTSLEQIREAYAPWARFIVVALVIFTSSRFTLAWLHWERLGTSSLIPLFLGGLRIDLCLIGMFTALPAVLVSGLCQSDAWRKWENLYYRIVLLLFVFLELITPTFIDEYDTRPNRLFYEYLGHPEEVSGMLVKGFGTVVVVVLVVMLFSYILLQKLMPRHPAANPSFPKRILGALVSGALCFGLIRGTISHRPINPATVAFATDRMINTLPLNSPYSLLYSLYRMKDERNACALYGSMPELEMHDIVRTSAQIPYPPNDRNRPSMHYAEATANHESPPHVVIILEESLGARYVGHLTNSRLTPELDALSKEAWTLKNLYATGTRSVRGIEAVVTGFLPTPARAVLKLGLSQSNFFTLANIFNSRDYQSKFIYGGEGHFDNMKGFLLNNGFKKIIDRSEFKNPNFTGTWGVSDEDMFNRLHEELSTASKPQFIFAFSVSNHSPYEYPEGRIVPEPPNAATVDNAVRYADWALGNFFDKAKISKYYQNTIFLIVADHDSRVYGASLIPIKHYHIPGMFIGRGIRARNDERLVSQIDLAPTLVSLAGISGEHPMLGHDLTKLDNKWPGRAIMQYGENFGYREGNRLIVLQPSRKPSQFAVQEDGSLVTTKCDELLEKKALAHALWPSWAYRNRRYSPSF
jgi:phosphoglycerol transferase MdoB-like AlkP superfamily enzyme